MKQQPRIQDELRFHADFVEGFEESYTPTYVVHGIHFGEGDPEQGGQHWNFTRSLGEDDHGVCTVKEIQAATLYRGIESVALTRQRLECHFNERGSRETGVRKLVITYSPDDETWAELIRAAKFVFQGESYATIDER